MNDTGESPRSSARHCASPTDDLSVAFEMAPLEDLEPFHALSVPALDRAGTMNTLIPLVVRGMEHGRYEVIDGCKRLKHLRSSDREMAACAVVQGNIGQLEAGLLRMVLNRGRGLCLREKYMFLAWLKETCDPSSFEDYAREGGLTERDLVEIAPLLTSPDEAVEAVLGGALAPSLVRDLLFLTPKDRESFLRTFAPYRLSHQYQREFLEWLPEIACARGTVVRDILNNGPVAKILESESLNPPQKIRKVRDALFARRFPRLFATQESWSHTASAANPNPAKVRFVPSRAFEKDILEINVRISSPADAAKLFSQLAGVTMEEWGRLIDPVGRARESE